MVMGKSMGAGFPINAIAISDDIEGVEMDGIDLHTFGNNQVSQVAALKQIEIIERDNILDNVKNVGGYLKEELLNLKKDWDQIGDIRALGFHIGVEFITNPESREPDYAGCKGMRDNGFKNGIIFGVGGTGEGKAVIKIKPPLITTMKQADEILDKFTRTLKMVYK
jgi:4-aminobutyrate aminotransferase-like enzyme